MTGALLLIAAGTLAGFMESRRLSLRVGRLETFLRFLSAAKTEVRYSAAPVARILELHGSELGFLRECAQACGRGSKFSEAWRSCVSVRAPKDGFSPRDRELLLSFGEGFGASDTQGQLSHLQLYSDLFAANLKSAEEDRDRKSKLYRTLGTFAGIAAALLLC